jgi:hypothetical protein
MAIVEFFHEPEEDAMTKTARAFVLFVCGSSSAVACAGAALRSAPPVLYAKLFLLQLAFAVILATFTLSMPRGGR